METPSNNWLSTPTKTHINPISEKSETDKLLVVGKDIPKRRSMGQYYLGCFIKKFFREEFRENIRPKWLSGLEIDFYCEELKLAFEFDGDQHSYKMHNVHTPNSLIIQKRNDVLKKQLCKENNVTLIKIEAYGLRYKYFKRLLKKNNVKFFNVSYGHCLELSIKCDHYRNVLLKEFNSPTATFPGSKARKRARTRTREFLKEKRPSTFFDDVENAIKKIRQGFKEGKERGSEDFLNKCIENNDTHIILKWGRRYS